MKISVITVCRNSVSTIGCTLESFFRQDHEDKEILCIDGQSSDGTLDIIRSFQSEGTIVVCEPDDGMYHAANKGLARFSGAAVGFLNSDDRFNDDQVLSSIAGALENADIVFGNIDFVTNQDSDRIVRRWRGSQYERGSFHRGWMPAHPSFYVRRRVVDAVGFFDLSYRIAADYDWMLRACELNDFETRFIDRTLVRMASGGVSTKNLISHIRHNIEALRARRRWLGAGALDTALISKPLRKIGQFVVR